MPAVLTIYFLSTLFGTYTGIPPVITLRKISSLGSSSGIYVRSSPKHGKKLICQFLCNKCIKNTPALVRVIRLYAIQLLIKDIRRLICNIRLIQQGLQPKVFILKTPNQRSKRIQIICLNIHGISAFPLLIITYLQLSAGKIIETAVLPQTTTADDTRPFCLSHIHPRYIPSAQLMVIRYGISETPSV